MSAPRLRRSRACSCCAARRGETAAPSRARGPCSAEVGAAAPTCSGSPRRRSSGLPARAAWRRWRATSPLGVAVGVEPFEAVIGGAAAGGVEHGVALVERVEQLVEASPIETSDAGFERGRASVKRGRVVDRQRRVGTPGRAARACRDPDAARVARGGAPASRRDRRCVQTTATLNCRSSPCVEKRGSRSVALQWSQISRAVSRRAVADAERDFSSRCVQW